MLHSKNGDEFTTGACTYRFRPPSIADLTPRVMIPIKIEGHPVEAVLDTGAIYLICNAETAKRIGVGQENGLDTDGLNIRGVSVTGTLHRVTIEFLADEGDDILIEVTAFVPDREYAEMPVFLGMQNCLESLRFAIEPTFDGIMHDLGKFHFGHAW